VGGSQAEIRLPAESQAIAPSRESLQQVGLPNEPIDPKCLKVAWISIIEFFTGPILGV
jgi:hypothetical protein